MSLQSGNSDPIRRYLLGELPERDQEQLELRLMSDDDLYQQLLLAEDDLIDEYISGSLTGAEHARFRRHFLSVPELRQDVRFTAALRRHALELDGRSAVAATDSPPARPTSLLDRLRSFFMKPAVAVAFATAFLIAVALASWVAVQNSRLRGEVEQLRARQAIPPAEARPDLQEQLAAERLRAEQLSAELSRQQELLAEESRKQQAAGRPQPPPERQPAPQTTAASFFAFTLVSGSVRDSADRETGAMKKITVPTGTRELRIRLDLDPAAAAGYRSYRASLETVEGRKVASASGLRAGRGGSVQFNITAGRVGPDDYRVVLSGVTPSGTTEEVGNYYFRVSN